MLFNLIGGVLLLWVAAWFVGEFIPAWWNSPWLMKVGAVSFFTMFVAAANRREDVAWAAMAVTGVIGFGPLVRNGWIMWRDHKRKENEWRENK